MRAAVNLQLRVFLLSQRRKTGKCRFTAHESGGKAATATFPPPPVEANWKMRVYRPCKRRFPPLRAGEITKTDYTADKSSGKAEISSFPPVRAEENWKSDFTADESGGKSATAVFLLSERGKLRKPTIPPIRAAVKLKFPVFLLSERRKTGKATLPPMRAAVNLQLRVFLLSQRRKTGKCRFTAHESGGKAATATFPPLPVEETWKMRVYRQCKRR
ncbi:hypothetical protein AAC387_Pa07g3923 [Persea americana]